MTWKSYATVSGATLLAGWLASTSPSNAPAGPQATRTPATSSSSSVASASTDIELQAMRLQARLRTEREYTQTARDPFRFAPRRPVAASVDRERLVAEATPPPPVDATPPGPKVSLSGIAEDEVDGRTLRTAVLSSPAGVLIVREGEEILGYYRVGRIESEAVELVAIGSGTTERLTLGAPTP